MLNAEMSNKIQIATGSSNTKVTDDFSESSLGRVGLRPEQLEVHTYLKCFNIFSEREGMNGKREK